MSLRPRSIAASGHHEDVVFATAVLPLQSNPLAGSLPAEQNKKGRIERPFLLLVEAAGIEPASASTTLQDTTCLAHSLCLAERYPKGREDVQPTAERFNGPA
jgi:hypothetical protein